MATTRAGQGSKRSARKAPARKSAKRGAPERAPTKQAASKTAVRKRATSKAPAKKGAKRGTAVARPATAKKAATSKRASTAPLAEYNAKRDFTRTREPAGKVPRAKGKSLHFVIQKHAASHLHYDFRLELDGVMKSWAVPKGPSLDPAVRRLAMEVEDHPISYNSFEGTIPEGEYGGGTVMLWDRGTYDAEDGGGVESLRRGYEKGDLKIVLHGTRLEGGWVLVRMKRPGRPQWLLVQRGGKKSFTGPDVTERYQTSVATGRTMDEITAGTGGKKVWRSNR